jgi:selenocysteine-specific elongation factor
VGDAPARTLRHLTLGTAGHIDHGKTTLVEALTGKNTDRLPEEQTRGISIDLGYAPLELPDGRQLSVVDVPGHERFVRAMVAGATGIDLFLLVIDAAEGARAQTHEHLAIVRLLGIDVGVVAVTKADTVDDETLELALDEAHELVPGAPVVAVSARTGAGLDDLRAALASVADRAKPHPRDGPARLYVDRAFTLRGIGTVVTGTLWSGSIGEGDELRLEPSGRDVRVRSVQVHDNPVERADPGQRVAVALPGVERSEVRRGDALVARGAFRPTYRLDVELEGLADLPPRASVHHGTAAVLARIVRIGDRFAQLRLAEPVVAARGDHVLLRGYTTLGGGRVLDPVPPRHAEADRLELLVSGRIAETVHEPVRIEDLRRLEDDVKLGDLERVDGWVFSRNWLEELRAELGRSLDAADSLDPGVPAPQEPWASAIVPLLGLERRGAKLYRPGSSASLGAREADAAAIEAKLGLEPIKVADAALARHLEEQGRLIRVGDGYAISRAAYESARTQLVETLEREAAITIGRFRDLLGTGRKTAQLLLERFDADGVTRRVGDERVLRRRAR